MTAQIINIPDIGGATDVEVIEISIGIGDAVNVDDALIVVESDKASMEIPSSHSGVITEIKLAVGDKVNEGDVIAVLEAVDISADKEDLSDTSTKENEDKPSTGVQTQSPGAKPQSKSGTVESSTTTKGAAIQATNVPDIESDTAIDKPSEIHAGPAVRQMSRQLGVDLNLVQGSGRKGRIVKEDVQEFVKTALQESSLANSISSTGFAVPVSPVIDFSRFGEIESVAMNKIQKLTAQNMSRCWLTVPHVTQFDEADITEMEAFRKQQKNAAEKRDVRLTPLPFLVKACAYALQKLPKLNVSIDAGGENLIQKKYIHIGVAVDTPHGLLVPIIRNADQKGLWQLAEELGQLAQKAKDKKLGIEDMQGACFTISSLGSIGGTAFTPIVNNPEVAILGVSKASMKPVWNETEFIPRLMLPLSLSYDHRAINGVDAARFTTLLARILADLRHLLL